MSTALVMDGSGNIRFAAPAASVGRSTVLRMMIMLLLLSVIVKLCDPVCRLAGTESEVK